RAAQGFANVRIALKDSVGPGDLDRVWKEIEDAIGLIVGKFPEGTSKPHIERGLADLELVVLAITGSRDPLVLREAAHDIREVLLDVPQVARVKVIGDP